MRLGSNGYLTFLHRFEQRGLHPSRGRRLISSARHDVGKNGASTVESWLSPLIEIPRADDVAR